VEVLQKTTTFRRLDLSPSSGGWGRIDLFSWARQKELVSITGEKMGFANRAEPTFPSCLSLMFSITVLSRAHEKNVLIQGCSSEVVNKCFHFPVFILIEIRDVTGDYFLN
jgi:hypothetical protein